MHVVSAVCCYHVVPESAVSAAVHCSHRQRRKSKGERASQSFHNNPTDLIFYVQQKTQEKKAGMFISAPLQDQHHMEEIKIQAEKVSSWSRLKLSSAPGTIPGSERKRGRKEKSPTLEMTQCRVEWNATLAPWQFATVQVFVGTMVMLAQTFSGLFQWFLETEVPFNLSHCVSEWTKMYSTKYLLQKKTLSRKLFFCMPLEKAEFLFSLQCPQ